MNINLSSKIAVVALFAVTSLSTVQNSVKELNKITSKNLESILNNNKHWADSGAVATYIPELAKVNPNKIAFSVVKPNGDVVNVGNIDQKFTMQSISKIVALFIAVKQYGENDFFKRLGYYGTDKPFNHFANLDNGGKPLNPMMNAGAILTTAMISNEGEDGYLRIRDMVRYITKNNSIDYNHAVYQSERETGHRNRGMFHILKNSELITGEENKLDNYFKQCSIEVTAEDLAKIGYFFANDCVRFDGDATYKNADLAQLVESQMLIAGMYDASGVYARNVGLPSKSGVGGGIAVAVPNKMGIGVYSAPLDAAGNSVAGYHMILELVKQYDLSIF
ncbi:glutaminase A [Flavobacterium agricola]|uniref:Glutaminase n=1 Tax=Flavobacterium agricola TaxID=2870839 RepID=A0ABY6M469_9FLAO|nr:glutaminase A [Flavobacterium agricola]UYW02395.1 glutaminase A [Flavobacterium agricola]